MDDYKYRLLTESGATERDPQKVLELVREFQKREMPGASFTEALLAFVRRYPRYDSVVSGLPQEE
jgi:hypothetical protein